MAKKNKKLILGLLIAAVLIAFIPLFALKDAEFGGSDDAGSVMVEEIHGEYEPWFTPVLETMIGGELPGVAGMHTIDHYCYHSGLRGVNAGLKFAYAAATMLICLISRSLAAAALVLLANGILTVKKGRIPFPFYRKLMLVPLAF